MDGSVTPVSDTTRPVDPGCRIVCYCQGAIEICLRFICIVLCVVLLSVASLARTRISKVDDVDPFDDDRDAYAAASGWLIFVSVTGIVTELFIVVARFLNIAAVNQNFPIIGLMDVVTSFVFTACTFAGWVPNAVYSSDVKDMRQECERQTVPVGDLCSQLKDVESAQAATAVFGALSMLAYLILGVYMIVFILFSWNRGLASSNSGFYNNSSHERNENQYLL